ncbi:MAG: sulfatase [Akkermansiaceae bacterium]
MALLLLSIGSLSGQEISRESIIEVPAVSEGFAGNHVSQANGVIQRGSAHGVWGGANRRRPNILFIAIDDQNDWIGCMGGHPNSKTPHIDALAKSGTLFANAHCQSPLCNPSRTSLMLGMRPDATGIYGLAPYFRQLPELKNHRTLAQHLSDHGYHTATTGKIFHGHTGRNMKGSHREWDELGPATKVTPFPEKRLVQAPSKNRLVDWGVFPHKDEDKGDYKAATWSVDFLKKQAEQQLKSPKAKPFFCATGFFLPHVPCYPTLDWYEKHRNSRVPKILPTDRDDTPRFSWYLHWELPEPRLKFLQKTNEWENLTRSYLACTSFVDEQVGRLMQALKETGLDQNTIVILWSDHGWHIGEKGITGKNTLWDDGTRVPLIFAGPGLPSGQKVEEPAELLDIYPTLCDIIEIEKPAHKLHGNSLVPQLKDPMVPRIQPAITTHGADNHGLRTKDWRYIRYADGSEELYYHPDDPNEWTNLLQLKDIPQAQKLAYRKQADELAAFLPKDNRPPAPNSKSRIITYDRKTDTVIWEGKVIPKGALIPEVEE